ncbi:hypothetical protein U3C50_001532 [Providencia rettgeri]|nr:hypothetical protein [Providencia rettgeri]
MTKPIVTSLGSAVPMTGNYTSGVRHNVFAPNKERELLTDTNKLRPYGNDTVEAGKSTEQPQLTGNQSRPTKHWELSSPVGYMTKPIVTSLGSAVTMKGNYTQGVRHNVVTPNKERESLTDANKLRPYGNDTVEAGKSTEQPQLTGNQSKPTKHWELSAPVGYMTKSIVTSLGSAVPMIGNYTQGVRHNVVSTAELANSLKKTEKYLPINSDASGSLKEPQNDLMFAKASSNVKHWPLTAPVGYMSKPIIASVGSSVPMSGNHTSGVMHNVVSLHENLSEISSNILKNIGLDKPVSLKFMGENLPVKPIDMTQLEYLPKK